MASILIRRLFFRRCHLSQNFSKICSEFIPGDETIGEKRPHTPVMVEEVIENLNLKEGNTFIDMTFGAGGHSEALLERIPNLKVFALDRDPTALEFAKDLENKYPGQITPLEGKFSDLSKLLNNYNVKKNSIDGILFDLGCSSMQLETPERGFSVVRDGPLDMRMDGGKEISLTAADVVAYANERDLVKILKVYGGEKRAHRIAQGIIQARSHFKPLRTTTELKDLIETILDKEVRRDQLDRVVSSATKAFQALRIFVNNEINELNYGLLLAHKYLKPKGRAVVISFHSVEDTVVKRQFKNLSVNNVNKPMSLVYFNPFKNYSEDEVKDFQPKLWNHIFKKVIVPKAEEVELNPRSRSARLRVAEKTESDEEVYLDSESLDV